MKLNQYIYLENLHKYFLYLNTFYNIHILVKANGMPLNLFEHNLSNNIGVINTTWIFDNKIFQNHVFNTNYKSMTTATVYKSSIIQ